MKTLTRIAATAALAALLLTTASAHDLYLVTGVPGAEGRICARIGEAFPESEGAVTADRLEFSRVSQDGSTVPLEGKVDDKQFCAEYKGSGPAIAEMQVHPRYIKLKPEDFAEYIKGEGFTRVLRARRQRGQTGAPGRELYSRYAKLLIGSGSEVTRAVGHTLEIVPLDDPAALKPGSPLRVRVLFRGKPLADAQVAAVYSGAELKGHEFPVATRTDKKGEAELKLDRGGLWYARLIHMVPAEGDPDVDWRSYFATLTFEIGK